jgi:hypothetical protein
VAEIVLVALYDCHAVVRSGLRRITVAAEICHRYGHPTLEEALLVPDAPSAR